MNAWLIAALALVLALLPAAFVVVRFPPIDRLIAVSLATNIASLVLLVMAVGLRQPSFCDLALTLAVLQPPAALVFVHFMERSP
jgi:multisubunit Na+/H+ antiporter MnhF subunit